MSLVDLGAPGHAPVGKGGFGVGGLENGDLTALAIEVAAQLAGDVDHSETGLVVPDVESVALHPDVVRSRLGHLVAGDLDGLLRILHVEDMDVPARLDRRVGVPLLREDLVADEQVASRAPRRVGVADRVLVARNEGGFGGRSAVGSGADIEHDRTVVPVGEVGVPVLHDDVVQGLVVGLGHAPAPDLVGGGRVRDVDDVDVAGSVVDGVDQVALDPYVVHAPRYGALVLGDDRGVRRFGKVEDHDPVAAVGRALAGQDADAVVRVDLDVVDAPGVELDGIGEDGCRGIGHVPGLHPVVHIGSHIGVVPPVHALEDPSVARVVVRGGPAPDPYQLGLLDAASDLRRGDRRASLAVDRSDAIDTWPLGDEDPFRTLRLDLGPGTAHAPFGVEGRCAARLEADHVTGSGPHFARDDLDTARIAVAHVHGHRGAHRSRAHGDDGLSRSARVHAPPAVHPRDRLVTGRKRERRIRHGLAVPPGGDDPERGAGARNQDRCGQQHIERIHRKRPHDHGREAHHVAGAGRDPRLSRRYRGHHTDLVHLGDFRRHRDPEHGRVAQDRPGLVPHRSGHRRRLPGVQGQAGRIQLDPIGLRLDRGQNCKQHGRRHLSSTPPCSLVHPVRRESGFTLERYSAAPTLVIGSRFRNLFPVPEQPRPGMPGDRSP